MVDSSVIGSFAYCGSCLLIPFGFAMLILTMVLTMFNVSLGARLLPKRIKSVSRWVEIAFWSGFILLVSAINGFWLGISPTTENAGLVTAFQYAIVISLLPGMFLIALLILYVMCVGVMAIVDAQSRKARSMPARPVRQPAPDIDLLIRQLTSGDERLRFRAATELKNVKQPLMGKILLVCQSQYKDLHKSLATWGSPAGLSPYRGAGWVIGNEVGHWVGDSMQKGFIINMERRWAGMLEGAKYYLFYSCDSLDAGLLELSRLVADNSYGGELAEQGQYLVKYTGHELVEPLIKLLGHPDAEIRGGSIMLLAAIGDVRSFEPIGNALKDPSQKIRDISAAALKLMGAHPDMGVQQKILREIVKVPCKFCGTYIENTATCCPSCGAPLSK